MDSENRRDRPVKILSAEFIKSATEPAHYPEGALPEIAFVGRSNVGKSSLLNTLVRRKNLAKTSNTPGRTQLINFFLINDRYIFVDLPGYGFARVPEAVRRNWGPMVETYLKERPNLRLVVLILDIRRDPSVQDLDLLGWLDAYRIPVLPVLTKTDKLSKNQVQRRARLIEEALKTEAGREARPLLFSAKTGEGKDALWSGIETL
jgi:GTP-binding protein